MHLPWAVILFDLDGTVVNTIPLIQASYAYALNTVVGRDITPEESLPWIGRTLADTFAEEHPGDADALLAAYLDWNHTHLRRLVERYDGMATLLGDLRTADARTGIVTSKRRASARLTLEAVGLEGAVDLLVTMEDTDRHKPHPAPLLAALKELGEPASRAVYVGDAVVDVLAARAAGTAAIAVTWGAGRRADLTAAGPHAVLDAVAQLRALLLPASGRP